MKTPFKNKNLDETKKIIDNKTIFFKSEINPLVESLIYKTLKMNPEDRPTCVELLKHPLFESVKHKKESPQLNK